MRAAFRSTGSLCKRLAATTFRREAPGHGGGKPFFVDFESLVATWFASTLLESDTFGTCTVIELQSTVSVVGLVIVSRATEPLARGAANIVASVWLSERSLALVEICNDDLRSRNCIGNGEVRDFAGGTIWFADRDNVTSGFCGTSLRDRLGSVTASRIAWSFCNRSRSMGVNESLWLSRSASQGDPRQFSPFFVPVTCLRFKPRKLSRNLGAHARSDRKDSTPQAAVHSWCELATDTSS